MADKPTNAEIQTIVAKTVGNCKPYELKQIMDALSRTNYVSQPPDKAGAAESTIATIFPAGTRQW